MGRNTCCIHQLMILFSCQERIPLRKQSCTDDVILITPTKPFKLQTNLLKQARNNVAYQEDRTKLCS